jgi:N-ethylmaleimide reductase
MFGDMGSEDNHEAFTYYATELGKYKLGYLHVMDGLGFGFHKLGPVFTLIDAKIAFKGIVVGNIDYTKESGEGAIRTGATDAIAYGRLFISNPDLVERFTNNHPLAPSPDAKA